MATLQKMQCSSCGGVIDPYKLCCNSCGMQYRLDHDGKLICVENCNRELIYLNQSIYTRRYQLADPEDIAKYIASSTIHQLVDILAEKILPLVEFQTMYFPDNDEYVTNARIAVAKPNEQYTISNGSPEDILGYGDPPEDRSARAVVRWPKFSRL